MEFINDDFRNVLPLQNIQTVIVDPPYNINFNYNSVYKDNLKPEEYKSLIADVVNLSYESTNDDSSLFIINYPEIIFNLYEPINNSKWKIHQWISWVYNSNGGFSKSKFTTAHRTILWLTKDNPKIYIDRVVQPYKNPNDKRIQNQIKKGKLGANLYNWWNINLVKFNAKEKLGYGVSKNQIPQELLKRLILTTTDENDKVLDVMCGSGSTIKAAKELNRYGIGIDVNKNLQEVWNTI